MVINRQFLYIKQYVAAILLLIAFSGYFSFHAFNGNYGIFASQRLQERIGMQEQDLQRLSAERLELAHRVSLLKAESLDPDMLEERVRDTLGYVHPNEVVVMGH